MSRRLVVTLGAFAAYVTLALIATTAQQPNEQLVAGELLVKYRSTVGAVQRNAIVAGRSATLLRRSRTLDVDHVRLPPGQSVAAASAAWRSTPGVLLVQPNYIRRTTASAPPNDPYWLLGFMWGLERVQAKPIWDSFTTGEASVVVADIDTGVEYTHPDLAANMWRNPGETAANGIDDDGNGYVDDVFGIDTANDDSDPMDDNGHGTHTAGTIGARGNNGAGTVGVAWRTSILACKFLTAQGSGTDADAIECFDYLLALKERGINIRVSNNSWGAPREGEPAAVLKDTIDTAGNAGILNVFSAGNAGTNNDANPLDPASFDSPSIIAVAASTESDGRASFSNYGLTSVDLAAPGSSIVSTYQGSYALSSGSSMAAPHVTGAAALVVAQNPALSVNSIKALLMQSADILPQWAGLSLSSGRLNVFNAVSSAGGNNQPQVALTSPTQGSSFPRSATVVLEATATDGDGTITQVEFFADGIAVGADAAAPYSVSWTPAIAGTYALKAVATDNDGLTRESATVTITIVPPAGRANVALTLNGGTATGSTTKNDDHPASSVVNGDRKGLNWGSGGGWHDSTANAWPDWLEVQFGGLQTIEEIDVITIQDNYRSPIEPTLDTTFSRYGIVDFTVEYWTGTDWQVVPGGMVTANNRVWRQFHFAPIATSRIRVMVTNGKSDYTRLAEVEAWASVGTFNYLPAVSLTNPTSGATFERGMTVPLAATASDIDGSIARVDFFANGALLGEGTSNGSAYTFQWPVTTPGTFSLTAVATDNLGAVRTSSPVIVTVTPPPGRANVALATYGATATASSTSTTKFPASAVINGDRRGLNWGNGGGWNDGTKSVWPDSVEIQFNGTQTIEEVDVFTLQDNYGSPVEPTSTLTFTKYGVVDFAVEYWTGNAWQVVPGAVATSNNFVWRQFYFSPVTTSRIRVVVTNAKADYTRLTEVEAYAVAGTFNFPPTVSLTSPAGGSTHSVPGSIEIAANATDTDGVVSRVDFYANETMIGTAVSTSGHFTFTWTPEIPGAYSLTAVAVDDDGKTVTSTPVAVTLTPPPGRVNLALQSNGSTVSASSIKGVGFPPESVINGDRKGLNWTNGGGWHDATASAWPDWIEIQFSAPKAIDEIDVITVQDNYSSPVEPTLSMTFTKYGIQDFTVEYWNGTAWQVVNGGTVTGNNKVWRQVYFAAITTSRIRILVSKALYNYTRIIEVEAWGQP